MVCLRDSFSVSYSTKLRWDDLIRLLISVSSLTTCCDLSSTVFLISAILSSWFSASRVSMIKILALICLSKSCSDFVIMDPSAHIVGTIVFSSVTLSPFRFDVNATYRSLRSLSVCFYLSIDSY